MTFEGQVVLLNLCATDLVIALSNIYLLYTVSLIKKMYSCLGGAARQEHEY